MAVYVALALLDGTPININPESVAAITPIPSALLPPGVTDGCYVDQPGGNAEGGGRFSVLGTIAAITTALQSGAGGAAGVLTGMAFVDGAGGALVVGEGILAGAVIGRAGPGDYTVTTASPLPVPTFFAVISNSGNFCFQDGPVGVSTFDVTGEDAAGAPADTDFWLYTYTPT